MGAHKARDEVFPIAKGLLNLDDKGRHQCICELFIMCFVGVFKPIKETKHRPLQDP